MRCRQRLQCCDPELTIGDAHRRPPEAAPAATGSCGTHAALSPSAFNGEPLAGTSTLDSGLRNYETMHFSSFK